MTDMPSFTDAAANVLTRMRTHIPATSPKLTKLLNSRNEENFGYENSTDYEHFVIRVDGRVKSHHRRFLDALREGLQLRAQFPQHDVKVQSMQADGQQRTALHDVSQCHG